MPAFSPSWLRWPLGLLGTAALLYAFFLLITWFAQDRILFVGHYLVDPPEFAEPRIDGLERAFLAIPEGRIEAWFLPARGTHAPAPAVIFLHGNGEVIDIWASVLGGYRDLGMSVLLPEYRGYGRSAGIPSQEAIVGDLLRWVAWLEARPEVDGSRLVYHGRSLGGGAACALTQRQPPRALVLQSTFTRVGDMLWRYGVPPFMARQPFDNLAAVRAYDGPIRILHGRHDTIIPFAMGERLAAAGKQTTFVAFDSNHNDLPLDAAFWLEHGAWLRSVGVLTSPAAKSSAR
jgi:fermentation-respiration switch protein FrsA (DUF1100 family)